MEPLKEFLHIETTWVANPNEKGEWSLVFDKEQLLCIKSDKGFWAFFFPYIILKGDRSAWKIKMEGRKKMLLKFNRRDILGFKDFEMGFKDKYRLGMFNPDAHHSFIWKKELGGGAGRAWHLDDSEIVRFEKTGGAFSGGTITSYILNNNFKESWLAAMLGAGFIAMRNGKI